MIDVAIANHCILISIYKVIPACEEVVSTVNNIEFANDLIVTSFQQVLYTHYEVFVPRYYSVSTTLN